MARKFIDCREFPSEKKCTVAIAANTEDEVIEAAIPHAVKTHGHKDTPDFRKKLRSMIKTGVPA